MHKGETEVQSRIKASFTKMFGQLRKGMSDKSCCLSHRTAVEMADTVLDKAEVMLKEAVMAPTAHQAEEMRAGIVEGLMNCLAVIIAMGPQESKAMTMERAIDLMEFHNPDVCDSVDNPGSLFVTQDEEIMVFPNAVMAGVTMPVDKSKLH